MTVPVHHSYYDRYLETPPEPLPLAEPPEGDDYQEFDGGGEFGLGEDGYYSEENPEAGAPSNEEFDVAETLPEPNGNEAAPLLEEINQFKETLTADENLSAAQKHEYLQRLEQWIGSLELGGNPLAIAEAFAALREEYQETGRFSPGVVALADAVGSDPEEIQTKLAETDLDLSNPPLPPSLEFLNFLSELNPDLRTKLEEIVNLTNERQRFIDSNLTDARAQNDGNNNCTSDSDNFDATVWQNLFDAKYHQDENSRELNDAKKVFVDSLIPLLAAVYGEEIEIQKVEAREGSGWEALHNAYQVADQVRINGTVFDLFDNTNGAIQVSRSTDVDEDFTIPSITYDAEGSGKWDPAAAGIQTYGSELETNNYDSDNG